MGSLSGAGAGGWLLLEVVLVLVLGHRGRYGCDYEHNPEAICISGCWWQDCSCATSLPAARVDRVFASQSSVISLSMQVSQEWKAI